MFDLTKFQRDMLLVISGTEDLHGLGIESRMKNLYSTEINHGRIYPNLDTLVEKGYLNKGEIDRRTNFYETTDEGDRVIGEYNSWSNKEYMTDTKTKE